MRNGIVATVERFLVGFLAAMVGKRLARNLAASETSPVGEGGQKNRVDRAFLLEDVEHLLSPFIDERDRPDLHPDHFGRRCDLGCVQKTKREGQAASGGSADEFT